MTKKLGKFGKKGAYYKIDPETLKEITACVIESLREEEPKIVQERHDRQRANIKLVLRRYRDIAAHAEKAVYTAIRAEEDVSMRDLLDLMNRSGVEAFRVESIMKSAAMAKTMVSHMDKMLEVYKVTCENSGKPEEMRRYRVLYNAFIAPEAMTLEKIAECEKVDRSTAYRDIDVAAERLAVLYFGAYGLDFL